MQTCRLTCWCITLAKATAAVCVVTPQMASLVADVLLEKLLGRWLDLKGHNVDLRGSVIKLKSEA